MCTLYNVPEHIDTRGIIILKKKKRNGKTFPRTYRSATIEPVQHSNLLLDEYVNNNNGILIIILLFIIFRLPPLDTAHKIIIIVIMRYNLHDCVQSAQGVLPGWSTISRANRNNRIQLFLSKVCLFTEYIYFMKKNQKLCFLRNDFYLNLRIQG